MSLLDENALRTLIEEEVRRQLAAQSRAGDRVPPSESARYLWTADDVATYLKASRSWVYQQSEAGRLPCLKVVGLLRFDPDAVRAFAEGVSEPPSNVLPLRGKVG